MHQDRPNFQADDPISIRAHHLLCMQGFAGYGYSQDFVANMTRVVNDIKSQPGLKIKIVAQCDAICARCPHNKSGLCHKRSDSGSKVGQMDLLVLEKLGLSRGTIGAAEEIFATVNRILRSCRDVQDICGNCGWKDKCLWYDSLSPDC